MGHRRFYGLSEAIVILSLLAIAFTLSAQPATIIDTLYVIDTLQGSIGYHIELNYYMGGVSTPSTQYFYVGDSFDTFDDCNVSLRSYLSFPVAPVPDGYHLDSALIHLFQRSCSGNGANYTFPLFYDSSNYPCLLAKVDYSNSLELGDFFTPILSEAGVISDDALFGWKSLDITSIYAGCVASGDLYCQLMLYFQILSDYDYMVDQIEFDNSHSQFPECRPRLVLTFHSNTNAIDNVTPITEIAIYPNPATISVNIKLPEGASLNYLHIYNLRGELIACETSYTRRTDIKTLDLTRYNFKPGLYIIKCNYFYRGISMTKVEKIVFL